MFEPIGHRARRSPVVLYFLLAFAFSWSVGFLLIANYHGLVKVPPALHYLASYDPALAAFMVAWLAGGRRGVRELAPRVMTWNIGSKWLLAACLSPLLMAGIAVLVNLSPTAALPDFSLPGHVEYLGDIGIPAALLLWVAVVASVEIERQSGGFQHLR